MLSGIVFLAIYFVMMIVITLILTRKSMTMKEFLVADRRLGVLQSALSIAATWIWAPALFISAERAYLNGISGLFWFLVPNILCLLIFIPFAKLIREQTPEGFTLAGHMGEVYSGRVRKVYLIQLGGLALLSTVVQFLAGGKIMSSITGMPFWLMTLCLGIIPYSYSLFSGIKASVITDAVQMILILVACALFVPWATAKNGIHTVLQGLGGISGSYRHLFDVKGLEVFMAFGLSTTIGLLAGPFGDQSFWQRVFSIRKDKIGLSFIWGSVFFGIVPLSMGILGFIAAGSKFIPKSTGIVNLELVSSILPSWVVWPFLFMLISGLLSTVDSNLCAVSSLTTDIFPKVTLEISRKSMLILTIIAVLLANIPGLTVTQLFLFYGTLRASTLFTTILTLKKVRLSEAGVYHGVILSLVVGLPVFAYGNLFNISLYKVVGSLLTVFLSGAVALLETRLRRE